jgi:hypothetical protein
MERPKNRFLQELAEGVESHPNKKDILLEYESHIDEILIEAIDCQDEEAVMARLISRLGTPTEISDLWKEEMSVTPSNMKWLFILINIMFFGGGTLLTLAHNLYEWDWLSFIWGHLTAIPTLIAFLYLFFWALLGYEIGKGFGHGGKQLLRKTFLLSLIPNLLLMFLTVFRIIPYGWFDPLLSKSFIIVCIIFSMMLYPICWMGYKWGKKASL